MKLTVLCTPRLTKAEGDALDAIATRRKTTRENLIREAVKFYISQCVPTQKKRAS